jgi:taurine transport system ATP-binding protein
MSTLHLDHVSLSFGDRPVLDGVDLRFSAGEFVAVIGQSGSGKTSLLNLAAGFVAPDSGAVLVDGRPIAGPGADRAVVFQNDALFPWASARENVAFALRLRGVAARERATQADRLLAMVGLAGEGDRAVWELSGGMRQRVGVARALAAEPRFLLMDEPLGALDAMTRERMQTFLLSLWRESRAGALFITHGVEEALLLATRVVVLAGAAARVVADIPVRYGARVLAGESARAVKADPAFAEDRRRLTDAFHDSDWGAFA